VTSPDITALGPGDPAGAQPTAAAPGPPASTGAPGASVLPAPPARPAPAALVVPVAQAAPVAEPALTDLASSWDQRVRAARFGAGRARALPGAGASTAQPSGAGHE